MEPAAIDAAHYRRVLGRYPTGVVAITAIARDNTPAGMAVGTFTSVSLDPPLIAFLPDRASTSFPKIREAGRFCANVLAEDQQPVCRAMAARGTDKFAGIDWTPAPVSGSPVINGAVAWIDCAIDAVHEAGDHYVVIGRVLELDARPGAGAPLVFFRSGYNGLRNGT